MNHAPHPSGRRPRFLGPALALALALASPELAAQERRLGFEAIIPEQVKAVERGLRYLAQHQDPATGAWLSDVGYKLNNSYNIVAVNKPHVGVTALALMAFLAGGHVPGRGEYGELVLRGLEWMLQQVASGESAEEEDGFITAHKSRMYSHAFATLFLAEVYGMHAQGGEELRDRLRAALEKAVRFTYSTQNDEGGWRYHPLAPDSDMSITVCQIMALRAASNAGIAVPQAKIEKAKHYVSLSAVRGDERMSWGMGGRGSTRGGFRYQLQPSSRVSFPLTAAGVTTLYGAGVYDHHDPLIEAGIGYLSENHKSFTAQQGISVGGLRKGHYFFYYGHYYAVQAMYVYGGAEWEEYFEHTRRALLDMQSASDGSWPNNVGPGPCFSTAVGTLILEIPFGYLPIFQK
ncbi:MAG: terpene cyclase/mutase family protein [Planctomycetes bacterium]|nr:terpene cyclase/mutase family protein [Planctomycetota bacterium]